MGKINFFFFFLNYLQIQSFFFFFNYFCNIYIATTLILVTVVTFTRLTRFNLFALQNTFLIYFFNLPHIFLNFFNLLQNKFNSIFFFIKNQNKIKFNIFFFLWFPIFKQTSYYGFFKSNLEKWQYTTSEELKLNKF